MVLDKKINYFESTEVVFNSDYKLLITIDKCCFITIWHNDKIVCDKQFVKPNIFEAILVLESGRNQINFEIIDFNNNIEKRKKEVIYLQYIDIVVDKYACDEYYLIGSKKIKAYKTIKEALDALSDNQERKVIYIKNGVYREKLFIEKRNVSFIGENMYEVKITYDDASGTLKPDGSGTLGTTGSASVTVLADGFTAENVTFENAFDRNTPIKDKQAVAIKTVGDKLIFKKCRFIGRQDTLYADRGRQYFFECYIEGDVDFIFGAAQAVFERCVIYSVDRPELEIKGYVTAASTFNNDKFGYLLTNCWLISDIKQKGSVYLGRPWHPAKDENRWVNVVLKNCYLGEHINDDGWTEMSGFSPKFERFYEYNSFGPGAKINENRPQLNEQQVLEYTKDNILRNWQYDEDLRKVYDKLS